MATSQNGWQVYEAYGEPLVSNPIPGTDGVKFLGGLDPRVDVIMRYIGHRWNTEVEPITGPADVTGQWGYNYRPIRGQASGFSNHSSATAVDINSAAHPIGTYTLGTVKLAKLANIRDDLQGVIRFGAFYDGRVDEMHAEANAGPDEIARVTALITSGQLPNVPAELLTNPVPPPPPTPTPPKDWFDMADIDDLRKVVREEIAAALDVDDDRSVDEKIKNPKTKVSSSLGNRVLGIQSTVTKIAQKLGL